MIRVRTPSRLHFGLFNTGSGAGRRFGGVGLMIDTPGLELEARPAAAWSAEGPLAERVLAFAEHVVQRWTGPTMPSLSFRLRRAAPEHAGLGTGTQLGLAVARAISSAAGIGELSAVELARLAGRGERSALGVHGFEHGGFLVEAGQVRPGQLSPLVARLELPSSWRVLLLRPQGPVGLHGGSERAAFAALDDDPGSADVLCRLALLGLMPGVVEGDLAAFGEALYEFNRRVGEMFASVQGGPYAGPAVQSAVEWLRCEGVAGAGQSSWGPTVFGIAEVDRIESLRSRTPAGFEVTVAAPAVHGACVELF